MLLNITFSLTRGYHLCPNLKPPAFIKFNCFIYILYLIFYIYIVFSLMIYLWTHAGSYIHYIYSVFTFNFKFQYRKVLNVSFYF